MGYIKIDRDLLKSDFWTSEPFTRAQAWIDLIGMANYADKDKFWGGFYQRVERGQLVTSTRALAERWGWSRAKTETFLNQLEMAEMISRKKASRFTTLTICNYNVYQDSGDTKKANKRPQKSQWPTSERPVADTQEESKESKEGEREVRKRTNVADATGIPTREEVAAFIEAEGLNVDADRFCDYYGALGWKIGRTKIHDWRLLCRRWSETEYEDKEAPAASTAAIDRAVSAWVNGGTA